MATIDALKMALRQKAAAVGALELSKQQPLTDAQYSAGFEALIAGKGLATYLDFIIPHLSRLLTPIVETRDRSISVLEIGPGPRSVLGLLPDTPRRGVGRYTALEPNALFAAKLKASFETGDPRPLPCLEGPPDIRHAPLALDSSVDDTKFDMVIFCHSLYGINPKTTAITRALAMLKRDGLVVVFHRDGLAGHLDGLVCHSTAAWPTGSIRIENDDSILNVLLPFVAGLAAPSDNLLFEWRETCRALGQHDEQGRIRFGSPETMVVFNQYAATALSELKGEVPIVPFEDVYGVVKNRQAKLHQPAAIVRPTEVRHIQQCVQWALKHNVGLTVLGGSHSGHCLWPNIVAVDMASFDQVHIITAGEDSDNVPSPVPGPLIVAGAGCKTGAIIAQAAASGLAVPLGARPSVGAGLWLQGGIGHLSRLHGLTCDAIVGAVVVSVATGEVFCVGVVPRQHQPQEGAARQPGNEEDLLWALRGAGTNVGIVVSVTFRPCAAPTYAVSHWITPLAGSVTARRMLDSSYEQIARDLPHDCSVDAFLFWEAGQLQLGISIFIVSSAATLVAQRAAFDRLIHSTTALLGVQRRPEDKQLPIDGVGLFDAEMYMSELHGGHGGGKTSAFKRCVFLRYTGSDSVSRALVSAVQARPSPLCYLHLLHGGGAIAETAAHATAFGCRDWDFACVITGVWPRNQPDGSDAAVRWVYDVARNLLSLPTQCCGVYGADLGPDPRDAALAERAFGPNRTRLARIKQAMDPHDVLACACPVPTSPHEWPKLVVLVTGASGAGKDFCAGVWGRVLGGTVARISDTTKREYAAANPGVDVDRLLADDDRAYKEQHRPALTAFFQDQVRRRPQLPAEHFLRAVDAASAQGAHVLLITGMRDEAPVAAFSPLRSQIRVVDVDVRASGRESAAGSDYRPSLVFDNEARGPSAAEAFARRRLLPLLHPDLDRLAALVRTVPDFPRPGIAFRHVLDITQQPGGLELCTSLLAARLGGDHDERGGGGGGVKIGAVAACEAGGFVFAAALASRLGVPLLLARAGGKLPPPVVAVARAPSHISGGGPGTLEMNCPKLPADASVIVVDDVLASGETLCAMLQLLGRAGILADRVTALVVAEFPAHRGRQFLHQYDFGRVAIQSLLVFGGS